MRITKSKRFDKQYAKLSKKVKEQFSERLILFVREPKNPLLKIHSLVGEFAGLQSFNVNADVRVMYEVQNDTVVLLVAIGTHSQLYS
jgi:addiction module RelE/StbE family toxin